MTSRMSAAVRALRAKGAMWLWLALAMVVGCGASASEKASVTSDEQATPQATRQATIQAPRTAPPSTNARATVFGPSIGFRSRQRLDDHFAKHGAEFGMISRAEYLRQAQALRDAPVGESVLEIRRGDGTVSRFDKSSGAFLAFDDDGIIRTYFKPNDGERYFRRQARRRAGT